MIILNEAQAGAVRGRYNGRIIDPVEAVAGLYHLPENLLPVLPEGEYQTTDDLLATAKAHMLGQIAGTRWLRCQTCTYDGVTAYADPAVPALTAKIRVLDEASDTTTAVNFKLNATTWRSWTLTELKAYGQAIDAHVQAQFDHEADLAADIKAASDLDALTAIDLEAGWP